jgi:hypothetical protein
MLSSSGLPPVCWRCLRPSRAPLRRGGALTSGEYCRSFLPFPSCRGFEAPWSGAIIVVNLVLRFSGTAIAQTACSREVSTPAVITPDLPSVPMRQSCDVVASIAAQWRGHTVQDRRVAPSLNSLPSEWHVRQCTNANLTRVPCERLCRCPSDVWITRTCPSCNVLHHGALHNTLDMSRPIASV